MPVSRVDEVLWDQLVAAFRDDPGNVKGTARRVGVTPKTAKRAWDKGYPTRGAWGLKSIKQLMSEEQSIAQSRLQHEQDAHELEEDRRALEAERDREAMRQRAIDTLVQEGRLVVGTRVAVMNALSAAIKQAEGLGHAMSKLGGAMIDIAMEEKLSPKQVAELTQYMRRYATTLRELTQAGQTAMEMERLYLGEPTQLIGVVQDLDTMPLEDLVKLSGYQDGVLQRAAERGLVLIPGGRARAIDAEAVALLPQPAPGNKQAG
jgi:hypothetical protein